MAKYTVSLLLAFLCIASVAAFAPSIESSRSTTSLYGAVGKAKPKFNKATDKWEPSPADDGKYPYDAIGALLRHGPPAFISRVTDSGEYEQFVLNYMAIAGVDRAEATGNIDAKLANPVDWSFQKMEEKKGKPKVDYTELKPKNAILAIIWALGITPLTINVIQQTVSQWGQGISADAYGRH
mmetsp:Transcript_42216/g.101995  ORF Transcript_42216/g.101995 Transcript_42216/m.101995 type:complete len:182 (-) Transcript_42216:208-753(-)